MAASAPFIVSVFSASRNKNIAHRRDAENPKRPSQIPTAYGVRPYTAFLHGLEPQSPTISPRVSEHAHALTSLIALSSIAGETDVFGATFVSGAALLFLSSGKSVVVHLITRRPMNPNLDVLNCIAIKSRERCPFALLLPE